MLESAYEQCLCYELSQKGLEFKRQVKLPVKYKNVTLDCGYILDVVVNEKVVLELKAIEKILAVHEAQIVSYLKLSGYDVGLLLNFYVPIMKDGIKRFIRK